MLISVFHSASQKTQPIVPVLTEFLNNRFSLRFSHINRIWGLVGKEYENKAKGKCKDRQPID